MNNKIIRLKKATRFALCVLLLSAMGMTKSFAYSFSAVCETGQTLYYSITNSTNHYVTLTCPGEPIFAFHHGIDYLINDPWEDYYKPTGDIILPEYVTYNNVTYSVTGIGNYAFYWCSGLTGSLTIPNSVTYIGLDAFIGCSGFTGSLTIPNSVTSIGEGAFSSGWEHIVVDSNNTIYDSRNNCNAIIKTSTNVLLDGCKNTIIPNSVTSIGEGAFSGCSGLTSIVIPNSVTGIGKHAFGGCNGLTSIVIPNSVTFIGEGAFSGCSGFSEVMYNAVDCYTDYDPNSFYYDYSPDPPFYHCGGTLTIGDNVETISPYMFADASFAGDLVIPNSVTSISVGAFYGCSGFSEVMYNAVDCSTDYDPYYYSGDYEAYPPFFHCGGTLTIGDNVESVPTWMFYNASFTGSLVIPNSVTQIGDYAFSGCSGFTGSLTIGNSVTSIGLEAFSGCSGFSGSLTIPNSVTSIGWEAFSGCSGFSGSLTIGNSVTWISNEAFSGCNSFTQVNYNAINCDCDYSSPFSRCGGTLVIGDNVQRIGANMFSGCSGFTGTLTIPSSVTSIGDLVFSGCSGFTQVNYNATNCSVYYEYAYGSSPFSGCGGTLVIGDNVQSIGAYMFLGCSGFTQVNYNATNCSTDEFYSPFSGFGGTLIIGDNVQSIPSYMFSSSGFTGTLTIPSSVVEIGDAAFEGCSGFTGSLTIPNSVVEIGYAAFEGCSGFTGSLTIGNSVTSIDWSAFEGCSGFTGSLTIPSSVTFISDYAFSGCSGFTQVNYNATNCSTNEFSDPFSGCGGTLVIGDNVQSIPDFMFSGCSGFTGSLTIPSSVTSIGDYAFSNCSGFTGSLTIPNSVTYIGDWAFQGCSGFTGSLTIPSSVTYIDDGAFYGCSGFSGSLTIPNSVTSIGDYAFSGCSGFTGSLTIPNSVTSIGEGAFSGCSGFTGSLSIPNSVTSIGNFAFDCCSGFTGSLTIPNSVTSIGDHAFYGCSGFTGSLTIPNSVTYIYDGTFNGCSGFTGSLTIPNSVTYIGWDAFSGCSGFTGSLTIPNSVTSIEPDAFRNCSGFTDSLTLGNALESIGGRAFWNCSGFTSMSVLRETPSSIIDGAWGSPFEGWSYSIPVYVPCGSVSSYQSAQYWNDFTNYQGIDCVEYNITASANPVEGGVVAGDGTYYQGQTCTLSATPNANYIFLNWSENGEVVSTNSTYSFTVSSDRSLVANFASAHVTITALANPSEGGIVEGGGEYNYGAAVTLVATANPDYVFVHWTENGEVVSTNPTYSFTATADRDLVANFDAMTNYWEPESNEFEDNMTLTCIVQLDGVEQATSMLEVGAFCGTQCRGSQRATYFAPSDHYIFQMIVFGESNDVISFRLYDHLTQQELMLTPPTPITFNSNGYGSLFNPYVLNFTSNVLISAEASPAGAGTITGAGEYPIGTEVTLTAVANMGYQFVNWMLEGEVVSTSPSYQFTVTEAADFVANFGCVHTQALNSGWNWWSTYIELTDNNGLSQLENSLGNAGILIKSRANGYVEAYQYNGATNWYGTLTSINNEQMYKVRTNANCNAIVSGSFALPESHPITINSGWNWIGFPCNQNVSVDVALSGFTPEANDVIKGRNGFTTYYSDENYSMWYGTLNTLEPGRGYMYRSNSTTQKTLVFQTGRGETTMENVTTENNIFQPVDNDFADNMTITAVLKLDGEELRSEDYELAAFVGDECRGSVKLMYVEPIDRYVAFLVVFGESAEALHFTVTDGTQTELSMEEIAFEADGMVGSLAEPKILSFGTTRVDENELSKVLVYPNPSNGVFNIQGQGMRKIEVFNAFGQAVVSKETSNDHLQIDMSRYADGCYMLRVVTDNGITNRQLIKK